MKFSSKTYDILKWIAQLLLPALGTLYFALASIWGFPYAEQVLGTITAVDTFLGVILGLSSQNYQDGTLQVDLTDPNTDKYRFVLDTALEDLKPNDKFLVKVENVGIPKYGNTTNK